MAEPKTSLIVSPLGFVSRVVHILSICILTGETIGSTLLPARVSTTSKLPALVYALAGIGSIVTGLINWYLFKPKQIMFKKAASRWIGILHFKLTFTILVFTPLLPRAFGIEVPHQIKTALILLFVVLAAYMRFWREAAVETFKANKGK
jgi:hypothetical protein